VTTRGWAVAVSVALLLIVGAPFFTTTTFHGDDHLFLTFARHAPHPFVVFTSDAHGGEYYRPLPMLVWWLLGRPGLGSAPFAALALGLHATAAALTGLLLRALGRPSTVTYGAAVLMLLAPANLDAATWFSASTDLLATVFVLATLIATVRGRVIVAATLALAAYLSKESTYVLPLLAMLVLPDLRWRRRLALVAPLLVLLAAVVLVRVRILHGWGGAGDAHAGLGAKLFQIASGLAHVFTGEGVMPEVMAFGAGTAIVALTVLAGLRRRTAPGAAGLLPLAFCAVSAAALLGAGWAVGARYFYLPAVGLAWAAAEALAPAGLAAHVALACVLAIVGGLQAVQRRADVVSYDRRVAAARRVVASGLSSGYRAFNIMSGVKDLDLAVKEDPRLGEHGADALVLTDVPASFVIVPAALASAAAPLIAQPPLPPSGAYQFGDVRVVGLARRQDGPSLREVWQRFPDIRFVRLRPVPSGQIIARDVTDETRQRLAAEGADDAGLDGAGNDRQD
jgi:type III secretion system FlhB-like substrate exporter